MNEWTWWFAIWGGLLALSFLLVMLNQPGPAVVPVFLAIGVFLFGLPFAAFWDLVTPCDGYDLSYVGNGVGQDAVCVMEDGTRFKP